MKLYKLEKPFAILRIRYIQYRYKNITTKNYTNQSSPNLSKLLLLQMKEHYYKRQFDSWGKYHPDFAYDETGLSNHRKFMNWLFPEKDFKEWDILIWHNPDAVCYYQNKIFDLMKGRQPLYEVEIPEQLKAWKKLRDCDIKK